MTIAAAVDLDVLARVGQALADDSRRRLLVALLDEGRYPSELADQLGLSRTNVSNHLACLRGCGLISATPEGRRILYELADHRLAEALRGLCALAIPAPSGCEHAR